MKALGSSETSPTNFEDRPIATIYKVFIRPHPEYGDIVYDTK